MKIYSLFIRNANNSASTSNAIIIELTKRKPMSTNCSEQDVQKIKRTRYSEDVSLNFVRIHNFVAVSVAERESRHKNFDWYKKDFTRLIIDVFAFL